MVGDSLVQSGRRGCNRRSSAGVYVLARLASPSHEAVAKPTRSHERISPVPSSIPQSGADRPTPARSGRAALAALLLGAATVVLGAGPASGAVFPVTTTDDGGAGSLRAAVALASASGEPNVIELQDG